MRISGGEWCGRNLKVPSGDAVRPTQDRVREALFSMLQNEITGIKILDLFAGAGSVGLEALSRGAAHATFVELSPRHLAVLKSNIETVKAQNRCELVRSDAYQWILSAGKNKNFDIVFADPPYELGAGKGYAGMLRILAENNVVKQGGIFIAEMKFRQDPDEGENWELVRDRKYGQSRIAVYRRTE